MAARLWRKAIPEDRDRLQSRVLIGVVGTLLGVMSGLTLAHGFQHFAAESKVLFEIGAVSVGFAALVMMLRSVTAGGAVCGGMICLILLEGTTSPQYGILRSGLAPLVMLFVLTFVSTRAGRRVKALAGLAEGRKGRSAAQVIANLSVAALSVSALGRAFVPDMMLMCLAALVEATADTVSSEIGQAFGGMPVMIWGLRRVEIGTDGAVTLLGSFGGIMAGFLVALVGMWGLRLSVLEAGIALVAGLLGLFFDSLMGAVVERRGWLGNDWVNFSSTVFAAGVALGMAGLLLR
jgi:uncharacterized protein (TIGR00297 family)